jgi:hypothetical protein
VVLFIESMNFGKLVGECVRNNDTKSYFSMLASSMSITSALLDIASVPMKALEDAGARRAGVTDG